MDGPLDGINFNQVCNNEIKVLLCSPRPSFVFFMRLFFHPVFASALKNVRLFWFTSLPPQWKYSTMVNSSSSGSHLLPRGFDRGTPDHHIPELHVPLNDQRRHRKH